MEEEEERKKKKIMMMMNYKVKANLAYVQIKWMKISAKNTFFELLSNVIN